MAEESWNRTWLTAACLCKPETRVKSKMRWSQWVGIGGKGRGDLTYLLLAVKWKKLGTALHL